MAVSIDTYAYNAVGLGASEIAANITIASNSNRCLLAFVGAGDQTNGQVSGVAGASATWSRVDEGAGNGTYYGEIWVGVGPATGAQTVTATFVAATNQSMGIVLYSLYNCNQATPTSDPHIEASGSLAVTSEADDLVVSATFDLHDNRSVSGCTSSKDITHFSVVGIDTANCSGSASVTVTWSGPGTNAVRLAVNVNQVDAGLGRLLLRTPA